MRRPGTPDPASQANALRLRLHDERRRDIGAELRQIVLILERLVGAIELVDQQNGRDTVLRRERLQQRALQQKTGCENVVRELAPLDTAGGFRQSYLDHLPRIVPLVYGRRRVEPLIALKAHDTTLE